MNIKNLLLFFVFLIGYVFAADGDGFAQSPVYFIVPINYTSIPVEITGMSGSGHQIVSYCGDNVCQAEFENYTTCDKDCKVPETVAPTTTLITASEKNTIVLLFLGLFFGLLFVVVLGKRKYREKIKKKAKETTDKNKARLLAILKVKQEKSMANILKENEPLKQIENIKNSYEKK